MAGFRRLKTTNHDQYHVCMKKHLFMMSAVLFVAACTTTVAETTDYGAQQVSAAECSGWATCAECRRAAPCSWSTTTTTTTAARENSKTRRCPSSVPAVSRPEADGRGVRNAAVPTTFDRTVRVVNNGTAPTTVDARHLGPGHAAEDLRAVTMAVGDALGRVVTRTTDGYDDDGQAQTFVQAARSVLRTVVRASVMAGVAFGAWKLAKRCCRPAARIYPESLDASSCGNGSCDDSDSGGCASVRWSPHAAVVIV